MASARDVHEVDVAVVGGGVAGLWVLHRLVAAGVDAVLFERDALGAGQTIHSQGMVHGGQRYLLEGKQSSHAKILKDMPAAWQASLAGEGDVDLSRVRLLAREQHLLCPALLGHVARFFLQSSMASVPEEHWPRGLAQAAPARGSLFRLDEVVVDCASLVGELARPCAGRIYRAGVVDGAPDDAGGIAHLDLLDPDGRQLRVRARRYVFAAGVGNEIGATLLGLEGATQRRPLRQLLVRTLDFPLYMHCVKADPRPRLTITAHPTEGGGWVWYLGGLVSSHGAEVSEDEAITFAARELADLFPGLPHDRLEWSTAYVDRGEPRDAKGHLPPGHQVTVRGNTALAWPTKMTLAPALAAEVVRWVDASPRPASASLPLAPPPIAALPWQGATFRPSRR